MPALRLFSTLGLAGVLEELGDRLAPVPGPPVALVLAPTQLLMRRIAGGETADVAILVAESVDALIARGVLRPGRTDLARSLVGIAVRAGAPRPDISTVPAFVAAMRAARSLALSEAGASGLFFAGLLERLGIAAEVRAKATVIPGGFTGALVASGAAEIAVQQVSELMMVPGLDIVGPLPAEIGSVTMFSAGIFAASAMPDAAAAAIALLASDAVAPVIRARGLEPPR